MKIAVVHPKFDRSGGAERYAVNLATGLSGRGHEVHLFGRRCDAAPDGARFHRVGAFPLGRALKTYSFWKASGRMVARERFDVVQGFGKTTCQTVHRTGGGVHRAYLERTGGGGRTAYDRVAVGIEDRLFASKQLRGVVCPSRWVAAEVARHYPAVAGRCKVISNGVDLDAFVPHGRRADRDRRLAPLGIQEPVKVALFVATNFRLKGLDRAVGAVALVPELHLVVVGAGDPGPFAAQAETLGCADRVHFAGSTDDPASWYRAADLLLHPTRYDPFANVCLEAAACGTPVVTTPTNGASDVFAGVPDAGRVVPGEPAAFAASAREVLALGRRAREAARLLAETHGIDRHIASIEAVYRDIIG